MELRDDVSVFYFCFLLLIVYIPILKVNTNRREMSSSAERKEA